MNTKKEQMLVYRVFTILSLASVAWIMWNTWSTVHTPVLCLFRNITGLPCPSCGITHSVMAILQLHFTEAMRANILGYVAVLLILIAIPLLISDFLLDKTNFYRWYTWSEEIIRENKIIAFSLIAIVAGNWLILILKS